MNIEYLKYFAELAKIQHYGKAAKVLNRDSAMPLKPWRTTTEFRFSRKKGVM